MNVRTLLITLIGLSFVIQRSGAMVDDALSFAYEAATPYVEEGFTVREEAWGGDMEVGGQKGIRHQLFRGNEYWFWTATDIEDAEVSVHIYDSQGNLVEAEAWTKGRFSGARVVPKQTGTYFLLVKIEKSKVERTPWAMVYGYR